MSGTSTHHPQLARRARFIPRGPIGPRSRALTQVLMTLVGQATFRAAQEIELEHASVFVYRPETAPDTAPALFWIHGGGLVVGDARQDGPFLTRIADELGVVVASVQYRLAPAHPYPAPLDDCVEGFRWLADQSDVDADRLMVGGASAGGGLAAALCQRLLAEGGPMPSFQLLVYPMLDDRSATGSDPADELHRLWNRDSNAYGWQSYLGDHAPAAPAVPARATDHAGLCPAWIGVGTADLFHDEDVEYAARLRDAGVAVDLEIVDGAYHGFDVVHARADVSQSFTRSMIDALSRQRAVSD